VLIYFGNIGLHCLIQPDTSTGWPPDAADLEE
jgi:hypothetical protein